jgi:hypothetical protein
MEAAGLAVGTVALFSLFSTCLETLEKVEDYKKFKTDSHHLAVQFEADKVRFEKWGRAVGIDRDGHFTDHHEALDDPRTYAAVKNILSIIQDIQHGVDDMSLSSQSGAYTSFPGQKLPSKNKAQPHRTRLKWVLRDKTKRIAEVEYFRKLVQTLHNLVPLDETKDRRVGGGPTGSNGEQIKSNVP